MTHLQQMISDHIKVLESEIKARDNEAEDHTANGDKVLSSYSLGHADALRNEIGFLRTIRFRMVHLGEK